MSMQCQQSYGYLYIHCMEVNKGSDENKSCPQWIAAHERMNSQRIKKDTDQFILANAGDSNSIAKF